MPYTGLVRSVVIDEEKCTCGFCSHSTYRDFEARKQAVIGRLDVILAEAGLSAIRVVTTPA